MKCNKCWNETEAGTQAVASICGHLFCVSCAQSIVETDETCPICESLISKSTVRLVTLLQDSAACRLHLCGQSPETALNSALAGINFYIKQQEIYYQIREAQLKKRLAKVQDQCRSKLSEIHNGYQIAKKKYQEAVEDKRSLQKDNEELQLKYSQKAAQVRKLQDVIKEQKRGVGDRRSKGRSLDGFADSRSQFITHDSPSPVCGLVEGYRLERTVARHSRQAGLDPGLDNVSRGLSGSLNSDNRETQRSKSRNRRNSSSLREILGDVALNNAPRFMSDLGLPLAKSHQT